MAYGQIKEQCTLTSVFYENYSLDDTYSADEDFDYSLVEENDVIIEHIDDIVDYLDSHVRTRHRDRSSSSNSRSYSSTIIKLLTSSQKLLQQQCKHRQNPPKTQTRKFNQRAKRQIRSLKTNDLSKLFQCDYDLKQEQELEEEKLRLNAEKKEKDDEIVPEKETIIRETTAIAVKSELEIKKRKQKYHKHHRRPPLRSLSAPSPETKKQPDTLKPEQSASFMAFRRYFYYHYRETIQTSLTFSRDGITIKNVRLVPPSEKRYSTQEKFMKFLNKNHDAQDNRKIPDLVFHGTHNESDIKDINDI
ncbi:unnamed protein product [Didymodactylos carnosus]|uniref:Uncharacterized protein n=1 Tax=Didymodactylos carnosus TaxID=1234261 RepID=A0A8S2SGE0_9BILA|nr:unnamed protein product [Didymodactylos carnosus]CAF4221723.1 unnamed protein product [Didymodactylos carnosus]